MVHDHRAHPTEGAKLLQGKALVGLDRYLWGGGGAGQCARLFRPDGQAVLKVYKGEGRRCSGKTGRGYLVWGRGGGKEESPGRVTNTE